MAWMHNLKIQKASGLLGKWLLLHKKEEFEEVVQIFSEGMDEKPNAPERFPCMAWFYDTGPPEVGSFPRGIYFYLFEARELAEADGFEVKRAQLGEYK